MAREISPAQLVHALGRLEDQRYWRNEFRRTHRQVGTAAARFVRAEMRGSGDRQLVGAARAVSGRSTAVSASVAVSASPAVPYALAATWGTVGRTGWYADEKYAGDAPNNPPWVGDNWQPGVPGEGPRGVNAAVAHHEEELVGMFTEGSIDLIARAFPPGAVH